MKVLEFLHVKPGKGNAFVRTKLRDLQSGKIVEKRFNAGAKIELIRIDDTGDILKIDTRSGEYIERTKS